MVTKIPFEKKEPDDDVITAVGKLVHALKTQPLIHYPYQGYGIPGGNSNQGPNQGLFQQQNTPFQNIPTTPDPPEKEKKKKKNKQKHLQNLEDQKTARAENLEKARQRFGGSK